MLQFVAAVAQVIRDRPAEMGDVHNVFYASLSRRRRELVAPKRGYGS
jgi:hypothetical protein